MAARVLSAILFSPRGGSASAARALARGLRDRGDAVTLVSGSRSDHGPHGDAHNFYGNARSVTFDLALANWAAPERMLLGFPAGVADEAARPGGLLARCVRRRDGNGKSSPVFSRSVTNVYLDVPKDAGARRAQPAEL